MTDTALTTTQPQRAAIQVGGNVGALIPQDLDQAFRIAQALAHSGMTPNGFKTPETCFVAIMAGAELGLPPFQSLQSFAIINNRPTLWGDALVAVVRTNGFKLREWYEGEGDTLTAFCEITRPDNGDTAEGEFSVDDAKTAGLWKKSGPWTSNPKRMLKMRARAFAIRDGAADVLRGFQIREEVEDYDTAAVPVEARREGTGLLAKLTATQTLAEEGFGVRNLDEEVADPAPKPKRTPRKPKPVEELVHEMGGEIDTLDAGLARLDAAHGNSDMTHQELVERVVSNTAAITASTEAAIEAAQTPADAQVEAIGTVDTPESEPVADGHAEPGEGYFLGDKAAFPSARRVWYVDGVEQKDTADDGSLPVYAEHAPKLGLAQNEGQQKGEAPNLPENTPVSDENAATNGFEGGAELDPFATFEEAKATAATWADLRPAILKLSQTPEWRARPYDQKKVRLAIWSQVQAWNDSGAKLDPIDDAFLFQAYIVATDDAEAIEGTFSMVRESDWFTKSSENMQASIGRFVMNRVQQIRGA